MGLDMYLYKVKKITDETAKKYDGYYVSELPEDFSYFSKEDVDRNIDAIKELIPYMKIINLIGKYYDLEKIKKDNDIPQEARICGECYNENTTSFNFYWNDSNEKSVTFNNNQYVIEKEFECYLCNMKICYYWRKAYSVQDYIHENCDRVIENCGFYLLKPDVVKTAIDMTDEYGYSEASDDNIEETVDVFYHEWY